MSDPYRTTAIMVREKKIPQHYGFLTGEPKPKPAPKPKPHTCKKPGFFSRLWNRVHCGERYGSGSCEYGTMWRCHICGQVWMWCEYITASGASCGSDWYSVSVLRWKEAGGAE
jgi:hypothetical protein